MYIKYKNNNILAFSGVAQTRKAWRIAPRVHPGLTRCAERSLKRAPRPTPLPCLALVSAAHPARGTLAVEWSLVNNLKNKFAHAPAILNTRRSCDTWCRRLAPVHFPALYHGASPHHASSWSHLPRSTVRNISGRDLRAQPVQKHAPSASGPQPLSAVTARARGQSTRRPWPSQCRCASSAPPGVC